MRKPEGPVVPEGRGASRGGAEPAERAPEPDWVPPSPIDALGRPPGRHRLRVALPALAFWSVLDRLLPG